jgi:WD40 repeat protein
VTGVAITPDGRRAVSASYDSTLRVWDLESNQSLRTLEGHTSGVNGVTVTPDERCTVSASWDRGFGSNGTLDTVKARRPRECAVA